MRKGIKIASKYIHTILVLAIIIPMFYAFAVKAEEYDGVKLYLLGLLILLPVVVTEIAIKKCRGLFFYLIIGIADMCFTVELAILLGKIVLGDLVWGYVLFLAAETFWVTLERFLQRASVNIDAKKGESYSLDYQPRESVFEKPRFGVTVLFVVAYLMGLGFFNPALCNQALGSGILYLFTAVLYCYVERTEEYLSLHKRVYSLPSKRIYGISSGILAVILTTLLLLAVAAIAFSGQRHYTDIREWKVFSELDFEELMPPEPLQIDDSGADMMGQIQEEIGGTGPMSAWVEMLFRIATGVIMLGFFAAVVQAIRMVFQKFRENYDENGDIVEELNEDIETMEKLPKRKWGQQSHSKRDQVRYQYRRFIRKHRKGTPGAYETPYEIETLAQVADSEEGKAMHRLYEEVRYGK